MSTQEFIGKTKDLIDDLKGVCAKYGLGNDGNEFKIITQAFLYKFMNDKFVFETKQIDKRLANAENWEKELRSYSEEEYKMLLLKMSPSSAKLKKEHFLSYLHNNQNQEEFGKFFDDTLRDISIFNNDVFSVKTESGAKVVLFDELTQYISDPSKRDAFARAIINQLVNFSFETIFEQKFDFFSTIFEYLIKDYNKDGGGKYAEYYTPHAVAKIMSAILVDKPVSDVTVYDPSAGSGTLLMSIAHAIGEDKCTIYSQDISQKSSGMLRLNLILNNLVHSISNVIQGDTLLLPYHKEGKELRKFDYIVSNPPFKLDFSDIREDLDTKENNERFFAGIPNIPKKKKESMAIYLLFIQHIMFSLSKRGKAAIVVPTGFLTAQSGIEKRIKEAMVNKKMLRGAVSMPSNIFATTGTNVSVLFLDKESNSDEVVFMDASKLGTTVKEGKNQKTVLSREEEQKIIDTFNNKEKVEDFSVVVSFDEIKERNYSFGAGQYFEIKIEYVDITKEEFESSIEEYKFKLKECFAESEKCEKEILENLKKLKYE
jgi:type I restriction enzyme M protein